MKILCKHFRLPRTFTNLNDLILPTTKTFYVANIHIDIRNIIFEAVLSYNDDDDEEKFVRVKIENIFPHEQKISLLDDDIFCAVVFNVNIMLNSSTCLYLLFCE